VSVASGERSAGEGEADGNEEEGEGSRHDQDSQGGMLERPRPFLSCEVMHDCFVAGVVVYRPYVAAPCRVSADIGPAAGRMWRSVTTRKSASARNQRFRAMSGSRIG
jgi:hypothetical protein